MFLPIHLTLSNWLRNKCPQLHLHKHTYINSSRCLCNDQEFRMLLFPLPWGLCSGKWDLPQLVLWLCSGVIGSAKLQRLGHRAEPGTQGRSLLRAQGQVYKEIPHLISPFNRSSKQNYCFVSWKRRVVRIRGTVRVWKIIFFLLVLNLDVYLRSLDTCPSPLQVLFESQMNTHGGRGKRHVRRHLTNIWTSHPSPTLIHFKSKKGKWEGAKTF